MYTKELKGRREQLLFLNSLPLQKRTMFTEINEERVVVLDHYD